ncbi:MAG: molybdopterin adenylyltransferase [Puniceicoccales bacterium]
MKVGRVTLSDRASAGVYEDRSGPEIEAVLRECWEGPCEFVVRLLPDDCDAIADALVELCDVNRCELVITTGGTGPTRRDVTPEATRSVLEKELPGFGEVMRMQSFEAVPTAILSRATAGIRGQSLILNLPGNPRSIREILPSLVPALREGIRHLRDDSTD